MFDAPLSLQSFIPQMNVLFWQLPEHSAQELLASPDPFSKVLGFLRASRGEFAEVQVALTESLKGMESLATQDSTRWSELLRFMMSWCVYSRPKPEAVRLHRSR